MKKYHITMCSYFACPVDVVIAKRDQGFGCGALTATSVALCTVKDAVCVIDT